MVKKVKKWKPKEYESFHFITAYMTISKWVNNSQLWDKTMSNSGNCFKTYKEANKILKQIKKILNKKYANNINSDNSNNAS